MVGASRVCNCSICTISSKCPQNPCVQWNTPLQQWTVQLVTSAKCLIWVANRSVIYKCVLGLFSERQINELFQKRDTIYLGIYLGIYIYIWCQIPFDPSQLCSFFICLMGRGGGIANGIHF